MGDLGKITITKNKDCDNKTYYSAYIYGIDAVIGGGDTRNEAKDELFGNIVFYVNYLVETNQKLKQQLAEKDIRIEELEGQFAYECECNKQLVELQKQLEEKQNTIDEINREFVQAVHDWRVLCAEKDKEIEKLKQQYTILENENGKLTTELIMDKYKKAQKEVSFGKQLAIQELEEMWALLLSKAIEVVGTGVDCVRLYTINEVFSQKIKELKGEKE